MFSDLGNNHVLKRAVSWGREGSGWPCRGCCAGAGGGRAGPGPVPGAGGAVGRSGSAGWAGWDSWPIPAAVRLTPGVPLCLGHVLDFQRTLLSRCWSAEVSAVLLALGTEPKQKVTSRTGLGRGRLSGGEGSRQTGDFSGNCPSAAIPHRLPCWASWKEPGWELGAVAARAGVAAPLTAVFKGSCVKMTSQQLSSLGTCFLERWYCSCN